jgi:hypothetical protein
MEKNRRALMPTRTNFPDRKRQRQDSAIERMTKNIQDLDMLIASNKDGCMKNPETTEAFKTNRQRLVDTIENTKKNRR